jgi:organic radical activating enzyme
MDIAALADLAKASGAPRVVVTGGEPVTYDLSALCGALHARGLKVHLETSGVHPLRGDLDWITLSPKKFKAALPEYFGLAHELKVIVYNKHDLQWAEEQAAKCDRSRTLLFLAPEWGRKDDHEQMIVEYIKANPHWRLSLQTHKYLNIP